ncbi:ribonuclease III [Ectothiorhodospiraceae bacterium 2226]|nr:ribonuclease III [Ectothiorhodospiraceae bacterium 2226]
MDALSKRLGYRFRDERLLHTALRHRSVGGNHNERLEFLGDGLLNFVIAAELFERHPAADEGSLSRLRASLVRGDTLAEIARDLKLGECLELGPGELKSGGFRRSSILADALEAVFGAVYLDQGMAAAEDLIRSLFQARLDVLPTAAGTLKDPKTRLQEFLQSRRLPLPVYTVLSVEGEAHEQSFTVECQVEGVAIGPSRGIGASRRKAEQAAAQTLLEQLLDG